ncbi:MAG: asparagine--tRNA ligase [Thermoplasmatales archaeon]|nr:asparagine--tRNA ligase [Thermoplasmatales archaeon]MCW6171232.1 asparagine--tRNA ligase [Thermoplasmatales archaeon]
MISISEAIKPDMIGKTVELRGWVYRIRSSGKLSFIILRDSTSIIQLLASADSLSSEAYRDLSSLTVESSLEVTGTVREDKRAVTGYEVAIKEYRIYQKNEMFPVSKDLGEEFKLDNRHLWLRSREFTAMLKVRSTVFKAFTDFYYNEGYYQVQAPMMVATATEGGSTLFKVPFFGEEVNLTQSSQFYLETFIFSLERVFTIAPSFRAEKSRTWRHLTEYWHAEMEAAWLNNEDMMKIEERMIEYIVKEVLRNNRPELELLKRDIGILENIKVPFERIKYSELIRKAQDFGMNLKYGDDLGADEERGIMNHFQKPVFITDYPISLKAFYHRQNPENPSEILCHDLLAPEGYGEIIGGGERIWNYDELVRRIKESGMNPDDYYWYVDLRKYGSVPHSGFGLGLDRLVMWILHLPDIKEAIPYPRTIRRTKP